LILLACALGIGLAACGSSSGSSGGSSSSAPAASSTANVDAAIVASWTAFFNAKTPVAKRISLLENGQQFASIIRAQAGKGLAAAATANVDGILQLSPTTAKVVYDILIAGTPALKAQSGTAVLQNGTWKVGDSSFCGLLIIENGGKATGLPAACQTAG
jgi:hypothetical protein